MAQKLLVVCDVHGDGQTPGKTIGFGVDGASYEIDLCEDHAAQLRDAVAPYVGQGRRRGGATVPAARRPRGAGRSNGGGRGRTQDIREWARAHGHPVSDRGRIPAAVLAEYDAAT